MMDSEARAIMASQLKTGSKPWRWDPRERGFSHDKFFGAPDLSRLQKDGLHRPRRPVENQLHTLRCGAYSAAVSNGYLRNVRFHPDWQAISIARKQGRSVDGYGSEPRAVMKSLQDEGSVFYDASPLHLASHGVEQTGFPAYYAKDLDSQAQNNRITAYLGVDHPFDVFDDIKWAALQRVPPVNRHRRRRACIRSLVL